MTPTPEVPKLDENTANYISCELSHDMRAGLLERIRWNNRAMAMVLASKNAAEVRVAQLELALREALSWCVCRSVLEVSSDTCGVCRRARQTLGA